MPASFRIKGGRDINDRRLDRVPSESDEHLRQYPLTASILAKLTSPGNMAMGVNWYRKFFSPVKDSAGHSWIGVDSSLKVLKDLGPLDGGHCVALKGRGVTDNWGWYTYYDQGQEGRCVQFGISRMMSLYNRKRYEIRENVSQGRWLYFEAQRRDEWPGGAYPGADPFYEGTSVNAGLWVVKNKGIVPYRQNSPVVAEGVAEFRWANDYNDVKTALGYADKNYVDFLNSWGTYFPHLCRMPDEIGARLLAEDGEFGIVVDRALVA